MKNITKRIISIALVCILFVTVALCSTPVLAVEGETAVSSNAASGFESVLSNNKYELYYKNDTAEIALKNKTNGYMWYSNPQDREATTGGIGQIFNNLSSQILVNYFDSVEIKSIDSYSQAASQNQVAYEVKGDTLSVTYDFGIHEFVTEMIPTVISKEYMEKKIFPKLDDDEIAVMQKRYVLYEKAELDDENYTVVATSYPIIAKHDIYVLTKCPTFIAERIYNSLVEKTGYDMDELDAICKENQVENTYVEPVTFTFVMDYTLTEDGLNVELDTEKMKYDKDIPPVEVDVLPFFGAANTSEAGYMFVPDGSGALINYNNKKQEADRYYKTFFGRDYALSLQTKTDESLPSVLPVFATSNKNGNAFYASVDEGYETAGITAGIADEEYAYNYVRAFFQVVPYDKISIRDKGTEDDTSIKYPAQKPQGKIGISYHFFSEYASYDKLATSYRDYLVNKGLLDLDANDESYVNIEFYATARVKKNFLGFTYTKLDAITSFEQAQNILKEFGQQNVDTVYTNVMDGGKIQNRVSNLKTVSAVGNKKELSAFMEASDTGYLSYAARVGNAKTWKKNSSYTLSREIAKIYTYDFISKFYDANNFSVLLNPSWLTKQAASVSKAVEKKGVDGVNLTDIGYRLDSNFNLKNGSTRHDVRLLQEDYLKTVSEKTKVSVDYGSIFSAKYVSKVWNIPMSSSNFAIEDESVPFYQIVLRGTAAYVAPSINQASDARTALLKAAEYGAEIRYSWTAENAETARLIDFKENYYDSVYTDTLKQAKEYSAEMKELFSKIGQSKIVSHKSISDTLKETKFESGYTVYVNYANSAVEVAGQTVDAEDFVCVSTAG